MVKYFTLEEAKGILPKVEKLVKKLLQLKAAILTISSIDITYYSDEEELINLTRSNKEFHRLSFKFYKTLEDFNKIGCILKDLDYGLVDFYSQHNRKDILLCWRIGEPDIEYWHDLESGFTGRRPIIELENPVEEEYQEHEDKYDI